MATALTDGTRSFAFSVFVSGDNVYVAGCEFDANNKAIATLWKNGVPTALADGTEACSVFVSGSDVYVAGSKRDAPGKEIAMIWKNGKPTVLTNGTNNSTAKSILVSGDDVYVAGAVDLEVKARATVWKNGVPTTLPDSTKDAFANSIFVSGGDVHVAGAEYIVKPIRNGDEVNSSNIVAKVWKNGVETLSINNAAVRSIHVVGGDVYVAGYEKNSEGRNVARVWKNGVPIALGDATSGDSAMAVFVTTTKAPRDER
jgi:hypothetical protein